MSEGNAPPDSGSPDVGEDSVLQARIDRALAHWPLPIEDDPARLEVIAQRIEEHISRDLPTRSEKDVSDEDLFGPPLADDREVMQTFRKITGGDPTQTSPHESNPLRSPGRDGGRELRRPGVGPVVSAEGVLEADMANQSSERERDRRSLQDLAKLAGNGGWGSSNRNSGVSVVRDDDDSVIDLSVYARMEQEAAARAAAAAAPPSSGALPSTAAELPESSRKSQATVVVEKKSSNGPWIAFGAIAAAAIVAGAFVMTRGANVQEPVTVAQNTIQPQQTTQPQRSEGTVKEERSQTSTATEAHEGSESTATDESKGTSTTAAGAKDKVATGGGTGAASAKGAKTEKAEPEKTAAAAAPKEEPAAAAKPPEAKQPPPDSLEAQIRQAAGVTGPIPEPVQTAPQGPAPGSVPARPSSGAVQGAVSRVLPGARACLQPDDAISHATIVFKSDGTVQSVAVTGGAAGTPAEGCIRSALMKAKVDPFSNPTFSIPVTVRPN